ncbi:MAG: hypothetical protein ACO3JL_20160, partial [Myxococcota bacterium]
SPTTCNGGKDYCNNANGAGAYAKTFTRASGCGTITINGEVQKDYDYVRVYNSNNAEIWKGTGSFQNQTVSFCAPSTTVKLFSNGSVTGPGINVTAQ